MTKIIDFTERADFWQIKGGLDEARWFDLEVSRRAKHQGETFKTLPIDAFAAALVFFPTTGYRDMSLASHILKECVKTQGVEVHLPVGFEGDRYIATFNYIGAKDAVAKLRTTFCKRFLDIKDLAKILAGEPDVLVINGQRADTFVASVRHGPDKSYYTVLRGYAPVIPNKNGFDRKPLHAFAMPRGEDFYDSSRGREWIAQVRSIGGTIDERDETNEETETRHAKEAAAADAEQLLLAWEKQRPPGPAWLYRRRYPIESSTGHGRARVDFTADRGAADLLLKAGAVVHLSRSHGRATADFVVPSVERAKEVIDALEQAEKLIWCRVVGCGRIKRRGRVFWSIDGMTGDGELMMISQGWAATDAQADQAIDDALASGAAVATIRSCAHGSKAFRQHGSG
jgi:hypothetical protein